MAGPLIEEFFWSIISKLVKRQFRQKNSFSMESHKVDSI